MTDSHRDELTKNDPIEQGIQSIINICNKPILHPRSDEQNKRVESAIRGVIEAYAQAKINEAETRYNPRYSGKTIRQFRQFMDAIEHGKTGELHSKDYVVMSHKQYEKIQKKLALQQSKQKGK